MFDRVLRQQLTPLLRVVGPIVGSILTLPKARGHWRANQLYPQRSVSRSRKTSSRKSYYTIKQESSINQQSEPDNLQRLKALPVERQRHNPDKQRTARINDAPRGGRNTPRDTDPEKVEPPNRHHNRQRAYCNRLIACNLLQTLNCIEVPVLALGSAANGDVQEQHADNSDEEAEDAFPADDLEGLERVVLEDPFLGYELGCGEDLGASDEEDTDNCADCGGGGGGRHFMTFDGRGLLLEEGASKTDNADTEDDNEEGEPLEGAKVAFKEDDGEETNEEDERATGHLVDYGGC